GKVTAVCAIGYFITSLGLSFVGLKGSVAQKIAEKAAAEDAKKKPPEAPKTDVKTDTGAPAAHAQKAGAATGPADTDKSAVPPTTEDQKPSDQPGTPVPVVPPKPDGTEGVPADKGNPTP